MRPVSTAGVPNHLCEFIQVTGTSCVCYLIYDLLYCSIARQLENLVPQKTQHQRAPLQGQRWAILSGPLQNGQPQLHHHDDHIRTSLGDGRIVTKTRWCRAFYSDRNGSEGRSSISLTSHNICPRILCRGWGPCKHTKLMTRGPEL